MANGLLSNSNGSNTDILTITVFGGVGVNHDSTLSGNGTSGSPLGVVNPDDTEVNSYVHNNSATIYDINGVVQSNSAQWSTEFDPSYLSGQIDNKLDSSSFVPSDFYPMTGNPSGFLTAHQSLNGYATEQWVEDKGYITGVDLTPYQPKSGMTAYQPKSGMVDYQTTAGMTAYATTSDVANKLETTAFSDVSGTFLTAHQVIPSAKWENASDVVESNSAQWSENTGDEEVNNAVYNNSAKWNEISVYESNSSTYLTAHQSLDGYATQDWVTAQGYITGVDLSDYAKTSSVHNDIDSAVSGKLDTTAFSNVSGDFLTAHQDISYKLDSSAFSDVSGTFLTAINIPESANWNESTNVVESNSAAWFDNVGDAEVNSFVYNNSATINDINGVVQSNSAAWGNEFDPSYMSGAIDNKLDTTAFADVSGSFLTAHQSLDGYATTAWVEEQGYLTAHQDISNKLDVSSFSDVSGTFLTAVNIPESANWEEATTAYQSNSASYLTAHQSLADYATTSELNSTSSYLSGAIDYVSANAGDEFPASANEAITAYQNASGSYLTAHQIIPSAKWEDASDCVQANSATWGQGGSTTESAYYITYGDHSVDQMDILDALSSNRPIFLNVTGDNNLESTIGLTSAGKPSEWTNDNVLHFKIFRDGTYGIDYQIYVSDYHCTYGTQSFSIGQSNSYYAGYGLNLNGDTFKVNSGVVITTAASSVSLPSANFEIDSNGQAYKLDTTTAVISVSPTSHDQNLTEFAIGDLDKLVYTTNITNGRWGLNGGRGGSILDNTIDLSDIPDDAWSQSTNLQINDYNWPPLEATLSYTSATYEKTPYLLSGQGGGNPEVESYVVNNSATIDNTINNVQTNSSVWGDVTGKQDSLTFHYLEI